MLNPERPRWKPRDMVKRWNTYADQDPLWIILTDPERRGGKWDKTAFFETGVRDIARFLKQLEDNGVPFPGGKALDFGCGVGRLTQALAAHVEHAHGVDISEKMIEQAKGFLPEGVPCTFHVNTETHLQLFKDASFDLVFTLIVLQHIHPDYIRTYLREFARITKPGGLIYFQLPAERKDRQSTGASASATLGFLGRLKYGLLGMWQEGRARLKSRLRFWRGEMDVEMHSIPKQEVIALLEDAGCQVLSTIPDEIAANEWLSYVYIAKKSSSPINNNPS